MSSGSDSDEDFVPGEPEQLSEEGSADEETESQYEQELEHKSKKRKATQTSKGKKKLMKKNGVKETVSEPEETPKLDEEVDPEEEKKREEDLWAKFLEGTDSKPKSATKESAAVNTKVTQPNVDSNKNKAVIKDKEKIVEDNGSRERRIFEFAGETIVVENNVIKEKMKTAENAGAGPAISEGSSARKSTGGISSVLDTLNKKNKLSTLEKSKLDWMTYKKEEGIEEEIESHNKGKSGYLDRRDFLERADYRQYEIERDLRMSRRSNR